MCSFSLREVSDNGFCLQADAPVRGTNRTVLTVYNGSFTFYDINFDYQITMFSRPSAHPGSSTLRLTITTWSSLYWKPSTTSFSTSSTVRTKPSGHMQDFRFTQYFRGVDNFFHL